MTASTIGSKWSVIKLGGTSQCKIGYYRLISELRKKIVNNEKVVVVLSAVSGVTNLLESFTKKKDVMYVNEAIKKNIDLITSLSLDKSQVKCFDEKISILKSKVKDFMELSDDYALYKQSEIIGFGETLSTAIFYSYLSAQTTGFESSYISAYDFVKSTHETFELYPSAEFYGDIDKFNSLIESSKVVVTQGFIASTPENNTILLGRGGSDTSGALIANMLNSYEYNVWTDVSGIYTMDPRIIESAVVIPEIEYSLAQELSAMGAKVMHPASILPCAIKNIPINIVNTFTGACDTIIKNKEDYSVSNPIAIALQKDVTLFVVNSLKMWDCPGFLAGVASEFEKKKVNIGIVTTSEFVISLTTSDKRKLVLKELYTELSKKYSVNMISDLDIISIVSNNAEDLLDKIQLSKCPRRLFHSSAKGLSLNFVVDNTKSVEIIKSFHEILV